MRAISNDRQQYKHSPWSEAAELIVTIPPTATPIPPTNTPIPPTNTPIPPTNTPIPPTNTPIPPTNTPTTTPTPTPLELPIPQVQVIGIDTQGQVEWYTIEHGSIDSYEVEYLRVSTNESFFSDPTDIRIHVGYAQFTIPNEHWNSYADYKVRVRVLHYLDSNLHGRWSAWFTYNALPTPTNTATPLPTDVPLLTPENLSVERYLDVYGNTHTRFCWQYRGPTVGEFEISRVNFTDQVEELVIKQTIEELISPRGMRSSRNVGSGSVGSAGNFCRVFDFSPELNHTYVFSIRATHNGRNGPWAEIFAFWDASLGTVTPTPTPTNTSTATPTLTSTHTPIPWPTSTPLPTATPQPLPNPGGLSLNDSNFCWNNVPNASGYQVNKSGGFGASGRAVDPGAGGGGGRSCRNVGTVHAGLVLSVKALGSGSYSDSGWSYHTVPAPPTATPHPTNTPRPRPTNTPVPPPPPTATPRVAHVYPDTQYRFVDCVKGGLPGACQERRDCTKVCWVDAPNICWNHGQNCGSWIRTGGFIPRSQPQ